MEQEDEDEEGVELFMIPKHKEYTFSKRLEGICLMFVSALGWAFLGFVQSYLYKNYVYIEIQDMFLFRCVSMIIVYYIWS